MFQTLFSYPRVSLRSKTLDWFVSPSMLCSAYIISSVLISIIACNLSLFQTESRAISIQLFCWWLYIFDRWFLSPVTFADEYCLISIYKDVSVGMYMRYSNLCVYIFNHHLYCIHELIAEEETQRLGVNISLQNLWLLEYSISFLILVKNLGE